MRRVTDEHNILCEQELVHALAMRRVIVTRGLAAGQRLVHRLAELGASVIHCPCVAIRPPRDEEPLQRAAKSVDQFDWLLFTSANAVEAFSERVIQAGVSIAMLQVKVGVVGSTTAAVARAQGWRVAFCPAKSSGFSLATELPIGSGERVLLPRADIASVEMPTVLRQRSAVVTEVVAYRTVDAITAQTVAQLRDATHVDAITFTSPSTVRYLLAAALRAGWNVAAAQRNHSLRIVCIGDSTAEELRCHGLHADSIARDQSMDGLTQALAACLRTQNRTARQDRPARWST